MKRLLIPLSIILLVATLFAQSENSTHHVVRDEMRFDFGFMPNKAEVTHTFWLHNRSADSIRVESVKPGCGCLSAPLPEHPVAPQDSVPLAITFHSGRFRDQIEKRTYVTTRTLDSTTARMTILTVTGFVAPDSVLPTLIPLSFTPTRMQLPVGESDKVSYLKPARLDQICDYFVKDVSARFALEVIGNESMKAFKLSRPPDSLLPASVTIHVDCDSSYNITVPVEIAD